MLLVSPRGGRLNGFENLILNGHIFILRFPERLKLISRISLFPYPCTSSTQCLIDFVLLPMIFS